jgi:hypothetical protein
MRRRLTRRLAAGAAVVVFLGGGALAAMAATSHGGRHAHGRTRAAHKPVVYDQLTQAAGYLGTSTAHLKDELRSGKTLAQLANETPGRSEAGLISALLAVRRARLNAQAVHLSQSVSAAVHRPGGPGAPALGPRYEARIYLGLSAAQLNGELRSGKTLAQVANETPGRSEAGLVDALVADRRELLADAVASGRLTRTQEQVRLPRLIRQVSAVVQRKFTAARVRGPR